MLLRIFIFLALNFGALAIGGLSTSAGVASDWYQTINKAPWTPPGWVFGFAWTTIMICYSVYLAKLWNQVASKQALVLLFGVQLLLNISWNPVFFTLHWITFALIIITGLTLLISYFLFKYWHKLKLSSILILPYVIWLIIATSLNAYILIFNS